MNKKYLLLAFFILLAGGVAFAVTQRKPQTLIHAKEGVLSDDRLTLVGVSPQVSFKRNEHLASAPLTSLLETWGVEEDHRATLVFSRTGNTGFASISLKLRKPVYDEKRQLLSFQVEKTKEPLPVGTFKEPVLHLD